MQGQVLLLHKQRQGKSLLTVNELESTELLSNRTDEILKALRMMKKGKAAGPAGIVSEIFMADEDCSVEWLTSLCNLIVALYSPTH